MRLGYACLNMTLKTKNRTCRLKTFEIEGVPKIKELTLINLQEVKRILEWNVEMGIGLFRITSDIVPFGSHEVLTWEWWEDDDVLELTDQIKSIKEANDFRLTVHPGQYTIINSPNPKVVENAFRDIEYHNTLLNLVGGTDMVIHVGGVYGDKEAAKERWINNYQKLSTSVKEKLILENDDKSFHIGDVLDINSKVEVPVCFDIHHHHCNLFEERPLSQLFESVMNTWTRTPKVHISSGKKAKTDISHHDFILEEDFYHFLQVIGDYEVDMMFEAKMKELAVLRIINGYQL